ncbi:50S ribosomal protein L29 [Candidatus Wolfebacteria bacterium]|nr:50S ribosomal protein L29 [Candidatus Wolfebacteria bacterium]
MKKQELQKLKNNSVAELRQKLAGFYDKLQNLKFNLKQGKVKNIKEIKETKKMIARILTVINLESGK